MRTLARRGRREAARRGAATTVALAALVTQLTGGVGAAFATDEPTVTWAASPADESGPDGRSWVELELEPGASTSDHLAVRNLGVEEITFTLAAADGYLTSTGRFNMLPSDQASTGAGTWIEIAETVTVPPSATKIVPFTVTVPANATPGDHAAGIAAAVRTVDASATGARVGVESRVGFRVMTRVSGELQPALEVGAISAGYDQSWNPFAAGAIRLAMEIENSGNVRLEVPVSSPDGEPRAGAAESGSNEPVQLLPGDRRTTVIEVADVWPLGFAIVPVRFQPLVVEPDGGVTPMPPITRDVFVWTMPWPHLLILLAVALIIVALLWGRRRQAREIEHRVREAQERGRREAQREADEREREHERAAGAGAAEEATATADGLEAARE